MSLGCIVPYVFIAGPNKHERFTRSERPCGNFSSSVGAGHVSQEYSALAKIGDRVQLGLRVRSSC